MSLSSLLSSARSLAALALFPLVGTAALVAAAPAAQAVDVTSPVVISEVFGAGGNSGSVYTNDFIELYNNGDTAVDLSTWSVQYAATTGTSWQRTNLGGSIAAKSFFLIQEAAGTGGTTPLPSPEVTATIPMAGGAGKVALVSNQSTLGCGRDCDTAGSVVDFVGYGTGTDDFAGSGPTGTLSSTSSAQRTLDPFTHGLLKRRAQLATEFGLIGAGRAARWLAAIEAADAHGHFVFTFNYYGASGLRPGRSDRRSAT